MYISTENFKFSVYSIPTTLTFGAHGEIRTLTVNGLNVMPLPLGYMYLAEGLLFIVTYKQIGQDERTRTSG